MSEEAPKIEAPSAPKAPNVQSPPATPAKESLRAFFARVPSRVRIQLGVLGVSGVVVVFAGVWTAVRVMTYKSRRQAAVAAAEHVAAEEEKARAPASPYLFPYEIKEVSVHFSNKEGDRSAYAQFALTFDLASKEDQKQMELNRAKALDVVFEAASDLPLETVKEADGFGQFKRLLLDRYHATFPDIALREIAVKNWILY